MSNDSLSHPNFGVPDADVLDRTLAGEASAGEQAQVDEWLSSHRHARPLVEQFVAESSAPDGSVKHESATIYDAAESFLRLQRKLGISPVSEPVLGIAPAYRPSSMPLTPGGRVGTKTFSRTVISMAAGFTFVLLAFIAGWQSGATRTNQTMAEHISTYTTANGQRATIALPDGSSVVLNVGSRLEVPANYGSGNRALRLQGEALFTVRPNSDVPFTVQAGGRTTRVLGTTFTVRHYITDTATTVAVRDGKVAVASVVLSASEQAIVNATGATRLQRVPLGRFTFAAGILTLDDVSLPDAITELNRWYDADIRLGDRTLAARSMGGRFAAGSLAELSEFLELTFNVRVVREGRLLTLYPRN